MNTKADGTNLSCHSSGGQSLQSGSGSEVVAVANRGEGKALDHGSEESRRFRKIGYINAVKPISYDNIKGKEGFVMPNWDAVSYGFEPFKSESHANASWAYIHIKNSRYENGGDTLDDSIARHILTINNNDLPHKVRFGQKPVDNFGKPPPRVHNKYGKAKCAGVYCREGKISNEVRNKISSGEYDIQPVDKETVWHHTILRIRNRPSGPLLPQPIVVGIVTLFLQAVVAEASYGAANIIRSSPQLLASGLGNLISLAICVAVICSSHSRLTTLAVIATFMWMSFHMVTADEGPSGKYGQNGPTTRGSCPSELAVAAYRYYEINANIMYLFNAMVKLCGYDASCWHCSRDAIIESNPSLSLPPIFHQKELQYS